MDNVCTAFNLVSDDYYHYYYSSSSSFFYFYYYDDDDDYYYNIKLSNTRSGYFFPALLGWGHVMVPI